MVLNKIARDEISKESKRVFYNWKKKLDKKDFGKEKGSGKKSKIWEVLTDFLLDRLDGDSYLSSLQLKKRN